MRMPFFVAIDNTVYILLLDRLNFPFLKKIGGIHLVQSISELGKNGIKKVYY